MEVSSFATPDRPILGRVKLPRGTVMSVKRPDDVLYDVWADSDVMQPDGHWEPVTVSGSSPQYVKLGHPVFVWNLSVAFEYEAGPVEEWNWMCALENASKTLCNATDGQMRLGRVDVDFGVVQVSPLWDKADMRVENTTTKPLNRGGLAGAFFSDQWIIFGRRTPLSASGNLSTLLKGTHAWKELDRAIVHEFAHYALYVWDEYRDGAGGLDDEDSQTRWQSRRVALEADGRTPKSYGLMDEPSRWSDELSSSNQYLHTYPPDTNPLDVTYQAWTIDLDGTKRAYSCWDTITMLFGDSQTHDDGIISLAELAGDALVLTPPPLGYLDSDPQSPRPGPSQDSLRPPHFPVMRLAWRSGRTSPVGMVAIVGMGPVAEDERSLQAVRIEEDPETPGQVTMATIGALNAHRQLDPRPMVLTEFEGRMHAVIANGAEGLQIARVSDPMHLAFRGSRLTTATAPYNDVAVSENGQFAVVAAGLGGLLVIDLSSPDSTDLLVLGSVGVGPTPESPLDAQAVNVMRVADREYALVVTGVGEQGAGGDLVVVEITDPTDPKVRHRVNLPPGEHADARGVSITRKEHLAAICQGSGGLVWVAVGHPVSAEVIKRDEPVEDAIYHNCTFELSRGAPVYIAAGQHGLIIQEGFHDLGEPELLSGQEAKLTIPDGLRHGMYDLVGISCYGDVVQTPGAFAVNVLPSSIPSGGLDSAEFYTDDDLAVTVAGAIDDDGDGIQYRFNWYNDGELQAALSGLGMNSVPASETRRSELWRVEMSAFDGIENGPHSVLEIPIRNSPPSAPSVEISPAAAPPNTAADMFINRRPIEQYADMVSGTNVGATTEDGEPDHAGYTGGRSVWWSWLAPETGSATFTAQCGFSSSLLAIYTGDAVSALTGVTSHYAVSSSTNAVTFDAEAGTNYSIAVDCRYSYSGDITLTWTPAGIEPAPMNHSFADDQLYGVLVTESLDIDPEDDGNLLYPYVWIERALDGQELQVASGLINLNYGPDQVTKAFLPVDATRKHHTYRLEVRGQDAAGLCGPPGVAERTIGNSPPELEQDGETLISSNPAGFPSSADFTALQAGVIWADADGDTVTIDGGCVWQRMIPGGGWVTITVDGQAPRGQVLLGSYGLVSRDDQLRVRAFGLDGENFSQMATSWSDPVLIANGRPFAPDFGITPDSPVPADNLIVTVTKPGFDPDRDDTVTTYWQWSKAAPDAFDFDPVTDWTASDTPPAIDAAQTSKFEQWQLRGYCVEDQASALQSAKRARIVKIGNTPPGAAEIAIEPVQTETAPRSAEDITVRVTSEWSDADPDDPPLYEIRWRRYAAGTRDVGEDLPAFTVTNETGVATLPPAETAKGQRIEAIVRPLNDDGDEGITYGLETTASVIIRNTPPQPPTTATLSPAEGLNQPRTLDDLAITATSDGDPDDGVINTFVVEWIKGDGDTVVPGHTELTLPAAATLKRDRWRARVYSADSDGARSAGYAETSTVVIKNTPPAMPQISFVPNPPNRATGVTVNATAYDPDVDDGQDAVSFEYAWYKNGSETAEGEMSSPVVAPMVLVRGDQWEVRVSARDSDAELSPQSSDNRFTVANALPTQPGISLTPTAPRTTDALNGEVTVSSTDADGDPVTYAYAWHRNGDLQNDLTDLTAVSADQTAKGQTWRLQIIAHDDQTPPGESIPATSQVTILNTPPSIDLNGVLQSIDYAETVPENGADVSIVDATGLTLSDDDGDEMLIATVTITNLLDGESEVLSADAGATGLTVGYDAGTGVLSLTGNARDGD